MTNKELRNLLVALGIFLFVIAVGIHWQSLPRQSSPDVQIGDSIDFDDYVLPPRTLLVDSLELHQTLVISCAHTMILTDALSRTIIFEGPATVRLIERKIE